MKTPSLLRQRLLTAWLLSSALRGSIGLGAQEGFTDANWTPMGSGMNAGVYALALMGTNVYAGGQFTMAGGRGISYLAKWDGRDWSSLGTGVNGEVRALAASGTNLYVGGLFTTAGGQTVNRVARWDGVAWWALGRGIAPDYPDYGDVRALAVSGSNVYVGGNFTKADYWTAKCFARWDGAHWAAMGSGFDFAVLAIAASGNALYAGGEFTRSLNAVAAVARWDGYNWGPLGPGVLPQGSPYVAGLAFSGTNLYVGGSFAAPQTGYGGVAMWDGTQWKPRLGLSGGNYFYPEVWAVTAFGTNVYIGGEFSASGLTNRVAKWDGTTWTGLASGVNARVRALAASDIDLYVAGDFTQAGNKPCSRIARAYLPGPPELWLERQATGLLVAWPSPQTDGFVLEEASSLSTNWMTVGAVITDDGTRRSVLVPSTNGARYYRLRRP